LHIDRLLLQNFRSYPQGDVSFDPGINVLCGDNAQGKTNLLEAVFLCAVTRSFRGAADREMLRRGCRGYEVALSYFSGLRQQQLLVKYAGGRKEFFRNGVKQRRSEFVGALKCVLFAPEHLSLIKNGPGERRRFIDMSLCQMKPSYYSALSTYQKLLEQKNVLLRRMDGGRQYVDLLRLYNDKLSISGAQLMQARRAYIEKLEEFGRRTHRELSGGLEELSLVYRPSPGISLEGSLEELAGAFADQLERHMDREIALRGSLTGCHRDDVDIRINGFSARAYGSQGQQRSCVLSLKMAECDIFEEQFGEYPVLLLDDIMSELDAGRQEYVASHISGRQVLITCCDKERFAHLTGSRVIPIQRQTEEEQHG
jgi:DNA replication and repair protein RecF